MDGLTIRVKALIAQDRIRDAIDLLGSSPLFRDSNELTLIKGRYTKIQKSNTMGLLDPSDLDILFNKLRYDLLQILESSPADNGNTAMKVESSKILLELQLNSGFYSNYSCLVLQLKKIANSPLEKEYWKKLKKYKPTLSNLSTLCQEIEDLLRPVSMPALEYGIIQRKINSKYLSFPRNIKQNMSIDQINEMHHKAMKIKSILTGELQLFNELKNRLIPEWKPVFDYFPKIRRELNSELAITTDYGSITTKMIRVHGKLRQLIIE